ncbi:hypothetical protein QRD90_03015 [Peribacillus frigoritolerans]|uniref:hypothetical protein n=1 Tax=Peribacillus frigoritolerans TaxID=450367 RepID=UPI00207AE105|nr:hypothetical protein [Peribacillus frigoritolerans]USK80954.1 hypothetical protein LHV56_03025 [Peribacillus frigoritolerans]WJE48229.1 hypothetical protein QRD90_03015 [Peribacillus frigoritolerans]
MEENGVDALETDKRGRPTSYISFTKLEMKDMSMAHQVYEPNDSLAPIDLSNYFELILLNRIMFRKHPYRLKLNTSIVGISSIYMLKQS